MSKKYKTIWYAYRLHRITAAEVWERADAREITETEAAKICGPRP